MRFRLLALDVDGTLLDSHHVLRPRVLSALQATSARGAQVTLATGKLLASVRPLLGAAGIRGPQIVLNGAATMDAETGRVLRYCPLAPAHHAAIIQAVRAADPDVLISHFTQDAIYMDRPHPRSGIFAEYGEQPPTVVPDLLAADLPPAAKILLSGAPEQLAALRHVIAEPLAPLVAITTTTPDFLEFFSFEAGKGAALADLRAALGLPQSAVLALGDGENDIPLFREAGHGIAMANASPALRAVANEIAPSNDDEGAAIILEALLREDEVPA